jgi:hypothetical protein
MDVRRFLQKLHGETCQIELVSFVFFAVSPNPPFPQKNGTQIAGTIAGESYVARALKVTEICAAVDLSMNTHLKAFVSI